MEAHRINLRTGEKYEVKLAGLSSAGYTWEYKIEGPLIVEISTHMTGSVPQLSPGGPPPDSFEREEVFSITALEPGKTLVRIFLQRPWERDKPSLRELCLEITINRK